jgi:hypothetical protein
MMFMMTEKLRDGIEDRNRLHKTLLIYTNIPFHADKL